MKKIILIGIATYNRNKLLKNNLQNIAKLIPPENCEIKIAISDNNPQKDALAVYYDSKKYMPFEYIIAMNPNKVLQLLEMQYYNKR